MSARSWDAADKARMEALVRSNAELQGRAEHAEFELQAMRSRFEALNDMHEKGAAAWTRERGKWVHDGIDKDARIAALVDGYKDLSKLVEETRGQTALRPLMRERAWLIKALERVLGVELEWDAAGVAWVEVWGNRITITKAEYDVADPSDLAAEVEDLALDTSRCPNGHLVNHRGLHGARARGRTRCPVCGADAVNPIPSQEKMRELRGVGPAGPDTRYRSAEGQGRLAETLGPAGRQRRLGRPISDSPQA